jgi:hypothetical protein
MNDALFSRSSNSSSFGKCTEELKTHVPEEVKEKFAALAVLSGQTSSEYLRDIVQSHIYGQFHVVSLRANKQQGEG